VLYGGKFCQLLTKKQQRNCFT